MFANIYPMQFCIGLLFADISPMQFCIGLLFADIGMISFSDIVVKVGGAFASNAPLWVME